MLNKLSNDYPFLWLLFLVFIMMPFIWALHFCMLPFAVVTSLVEWASDSWGAVEEAETLGEFSFALFILVPMALIFMLLDCFRAWFDGFLDSMRDMNNDIRQAYEDCR